MRRLYPGKNAPVWLRAATTAALVALGCGDSTVEGEGSTGGTGTGTGTMPTSITSASVTITTVGATDSTTDAPTGSDTTFSSLSNVDTTYASFGESGFAETCRKVDVIFAIDNSGSMAEEIEALTGPVFDSFPAALLAVGNGIDDFHLAVIDACPTPAYYHNFGAGGACNFSTGANWMVSTSPALTAEYQCVTALSATGWNGMPDTCDTTNDDDEQPARAASTSLAPEAISAANTGFLRDDALLLVVAITDEDEELFGGIAPAEITQQIIDAKGTIDEVIFLGIGGGSECDGPYGSALAADNLQTITQTFVDAERGLFWDLCQGDLETAFQQAIEIVDGVCNDVIPL